MKPAKRTNKRAGNYPPIRLCIAVIDQAVSDHGDREKQAAERDCANKAGQFLHVHSFYLPHSQLAGSSRGRHPLCFR